NDCKFDDSTQRCTIGDVYAISNCCKGITQKASKHGAEQDEDRGTDGSGDEEQQALQEICYRQKIHQADRCSCETEEEEEENYLCNDLRQWCAYPQSSHRGDNHCTVRQLL